MKEDELITAVKSQNRQSLMRIIESKSTDLNMKSYQDKNRTALHIACDLEYTDVVKDLLSDPFVQLNSKDKEQSTPLHLLLRKDVPNLEILLMLLKDKKRNPELSSLDTNYRTSLSVGCSHNSTIDAIAYLLAHPKMDLYSVFHVTPVGVNPLWCCCEYDKENHIKFLFATGLPFQVDEKSDSGLYFTPLEVARKSKKNNILKLLTSYEKDKQGTIALCRKETSYFEKISSCAIELENWNFLKRLMADSDFPETTRKEILSRPNLSEEVLKNINPASWDLYKGKVYVENKILFSYNPSGKMEVTSLEDSQPIISVIRSNTTSISIQDLDLDSKFWKSFESLICGVLTEASFVKLKIVNCQLPPDSAKVIASLIKNKLTMKTLILKGVGLKAKFSQEVLAAIVQNVIALKYNLMKIELDPFEIKSDVPLHGIPQEIVKKGSGAIIQYILDVGKNPNSDKVYRTKLMIVGHQNVGKTALLDCIFSETETLGKKRKNIPVFRSHKFSLSGSTMVQHPDKENPRGNIYYLHKDGWVLSEENENDLILRSPAKTLQLRFYKENLRRKWVDRVKRAIRNESTHGIDVKKNIMEPQIEGYATKIEFSVWDFAGQHEYYNNHHHFLSSRSVYLVAWDMNEENTLNTLEFWLKSLFCHLPSVSDGELSKDYGIIIVGTHLDLFDNLGAEEKKKKIDTSRKNIQDKLIQYGFHIPVDIIEISSKSLENIDKLKKTIYLRAINHSYMGEIVPSSYLVVQKCLEKLRNKSEVENDLPLCSISTLESCFKDYPTFDISRPLLIRALALLSLWGECVYFEQPRALSDIIILDPRFLTKHVLGQLFNPEHSSFIKSGIIGHENLSVVWKGLETRVQFLVGLMEKFDVCFRLVNDSSNSTEAEKDEINQSIDFYKQKSVVPALLPETLNDEQSNYIESINKSSTFSMERYLVFNVIPLELVSRLLSRLHDYLEKNILWRRGLLITKFDCYALMTANVEKSYLQIRSMGPNRVLCVDLIEKVIQLTKLTSKKYPGISFQECAVSPFDPYSFVPLSECFDDLLLKENERKLVCPSRKVPLSAYELLLKAGMIEKEERKVNSNWWWRFETDTKWKEHKQLRRYYSLKIYDEGKVHDETYIEKLSILLKEMGFDMSHVEKAHAIYNPKLFESFENCRDFISSEISNRIIKSKLNWGSLGNKEIREFYDKALGTYISKFRSNDWNDSILPFVVPMAHGSSREMAWDIAEDGFGAPVIRDEGFLGKGIYFTSNLNYAKGCSTDKTVIISCVICGNAYPSAENPWSTNSMVGKGCISGYQSHYALVSEKVKGSFVPVSKPSLSDYDEMAVFERSQVLPVFILSLK